MRTLLVVALLTLSAFVAPPSAVAASPPLLTDEANDVALFGGRAGDVSSPTVPMVLEDFKAVDLLSLTVEETDEELDLTLAVAGMSGPASGASYRIFFEWQDTEYAVVCARILSAGGGERTYSFLTRLTEGDGFSFYEYVSELSLTVDTSAATLRTQVPKVYILDEDRRMPGRGESIEDVRVMSFRQQGLGPGNGINFGTGMRDVMPEDGGALFTMTKGDYAVGTLHLRSDDRIRVSNGEATTFVYEVTVSNTADVEDEVALTLTGIPDGWTTTVADKVRVPGKSEKMVPLLASIPFGHEHGGFTSFNLTAKSGRDAASEAQMRLGVLHTPIPQPTGHHSELYLHGESFSMPPFDTLPFLNWVGGYMNTDADHTNDAPAISPGFNDNAFTWWIGLNPSLEMGLDFDLARTGTLEGSILSKRPLEGDLSAELVLYRRDGGDWDDMLLAESALTPVSVAANAATPFKMTIVPVAESDYIPYARDQYLSLILRLNGQNINAICCGSGLEPTLQTSDWKLKLPLNEYHDRLSGQAEAVSALSLLADGPVQKSGRPGSVLTYAFTLKNEGTEETFDVDVAGTDAALGRLVPAGGIKLAAGDMRKLTLAVTVPADANDGEEFEVLLFAHARSDPSKTAVARTKTVAALEGNVTPDETEVLLAAQDAERATPGAPLAIALVGLAALAASRRRR